MHKLLLPLLFICNLAFGQAPSRFYTKFGGNGIDVGYSAKPTLDGQYIIAGSTSSYGAGNTDVYLVKLDSMGNIMWEKTFGGFLNDVGKAVIQVADSGYFIAGFTNSYGAGGYDAYLIRTDKMGTLIWQKTYGGLDWDFATDLVRTPDGDLAVVGNTSSYGAGKKDGFALKYDFLGNLIWQKQFGGVEDDELKAIITTNDNYLAAVGYTQSKGDVNGDCYFLKLNLNGDTLFTKTFGGVYKDYATDFTQMNNNEYIIVGAKTFSANVKTHSYSIRCDAAGNFIFDIESYNSTDDENWVSVTNSYASNYHWASLREVPVPALLTQGNIFVHGGSNPGNDPYPYLVNSFGGNNEEHFYSMDKTKDGGYISIGTTESYGALNGDVFFIKEDSTIINYTNIIGIKENSQEVSKVLLKNINNNLYQIEMESTNYKLLTLTDLYGKEIYNHKIENKNELISLSEYPSGLYLLTLSSDIEKTRTFKLINR